MSLAVDQCLAPSGCRLNEDCKPVGGGGQLHATSPFDSPEFKVNRTWFLRNLDPDDLRRHIENKQLLTSAQLDTLADQQSIVKQNEYFIEMVLKPRRIEGFIAFLDILNTAGDQFTARRQQLERLVDAFYGQEEDKLGHTTEEDDLYGGDPGGQFEFQVGHTQGRTQPMPTTSGGCQQNGLDVASPPMHLPSVDCNQFPSYGSNMSTRHPNSIISANHRLAKGYSSTASTDGVDDPNSQASGGWAAHFRDDHSENYHCAICMNILREPMQTGCGHRYCRPCILPIMQGRDPKCPVDRSPVGGIFPDKHCQREIDNFEVFCNFKDACRWTGILKYLEDHLQKCEFVPVQCSNFKLGCTVCVQRKLLKHHVENDCKFRQDRCDLCQQLVAIFQQDEHIATVCPKAIVMCAQGCGVKFPRKELQLHLSTVCAEMEVPCTLGCGQQVKRRLMADHTTSQAGMMLHMQTLFAENKALKETVSERDEALRVKDEAMRAKDDIIKSMKKEIGHLSARLATTELKMEEGFAKQEHDIGRCQQDLQAVQATAGGASGQDGERLALVERRVATVEHASRETKDVVARVEQSVQRSVDGLDLRLFEREQYSDNGILIWKFPNFSQHLENAKKGVKTSHYSPPFYSSRHGYKACARMYPNGDGAGYGKYVSLFFVIMAGDFDDLQVWPYNRRVTLTMLDQSPTRRDVNETFMPDVRSNSFKRPTSGMNVASGCPCFISHKVLQSASQQYLHNDTLYLKLRMDTSGLNNI